MNTNVESFFDPATFTLTHLVVDGARQKCAIIDSVLDYDNASGRTSTETADRLIDHIKQQGLTVDWILETHVHADHLTAAPYLKKALGGKIGIGANVKTVQRTFKDIFNLDDIVPDGTPFDHLFADGETVKVGDLEGYVMFTPGHTPACVSYVFGDAIFVGDTLFSPDFGTARCDFPGGDAATLYASLQKILALPDETRIFLCHDYQPGGRDVMIQTTVGEQKQANIHLAGGIDEAAFTKMRSERDATLSMPTLLLPSVQINVRAGEMPPPEDNGVRYMKTPIDQL